MITHYRVDMRVVHGQTVTILKKSFPLNRIIVIDDEIAKYNKEVYGIQEELLKEQKRPFFNLIWDCRMAFFAILQVVVEIDQKGSGQE